MEQLSLSTTTTEPTHPGAGAPQGRVAWLTATRESNEGRAQPKINLNCLKDICTPMFIAALFTVAKTWKQPKYPG